MPLCDTSDRVPSDGVTIRAAMLPIPAKRTCAARRARPELRDRGCAPRVARSP